MDCNNIIMQLKSCHNIILTGAPVTGKTYLAKQIAAQMILGKEKAETDEEEAILKNRTDFVQFHPSYDYTDFVEGLRPMPVSEDKTDIKFERRDGVFKEFCAKAIKSYDCVEGTSNKALTTGVKEDDIERAFRLLWEKIRKEDGDVSLKMFSGIDSLPMMVEEDKKETIYFSKKEDHTTKSVGNEVTLEKIKTAILDKGIYSTDILKRTQYPRSKEEAKEILGSQGNYPNTWSVLAYILDHISPIPVSAKKTNTPYIFIIDEINRGELSKIFGELFFSIDPGYRGEEGRVSTQYQNLITDDTDPFKDGFYVPNNVYMIGTMNDIDRSIESMDFAIRRRFAWVEVKANDNTEMLSNLKTVERSKAEKVMFALNNAIWDDDAKKGIEGLSRAYHIGASYFLKLDNFKESDNPFVDLWDLHLEGLLREYLRGLDEAKEKLNTLQKAYNEATGING